MIPTPEVMAEYIREDLAELDKPHRQDKDRILEDLRWSFRACWYLTVPKMDWQAVH